MKLRQGSMKVYLPFWGILYLSRLISCTIDLTLPEFQYLANHLTKDECRKLIASLHFASFDLNQNVENAENALPEDISCLKLLLHWNASPNEGQGISHEKVSLRLRQMGRHDLADWLDKAVLQELEEEIVEMADEFKNKEMVEGTANVYEEDLEEQFIMDFTFVDLLVFAVGLLCISALCFTLFLVGYRFYRQYRESKLDTRRIVEDNYKDKVRGSKLFKRFSILQQEHLNT